MPQPEFRAICSYCRFDPKTTYASYAELRNHVVEAHPDKATFYPIRIQR